MAITAWDDWYTVLRIESATESQCTPIRCGIGNIVSIYKALTRGRSNENAQDGNQICLVRSPSIVHSVFFAVFSDHFHPLHLVS